MKSWIVFFLFGSSLVFGAEFHFKDRLQKGKSGDYIVAEANKMVTLLAIRSVTPTTLVLEEISAPTQNLKKMPASWSAWVREKAPGHTSWSMIEIDLKSGQVIECYSFSRSAWIQVSSQESLFSTLLQLPLKPIDPDKRRKIGPPPVSDEIDRRKIWNPPLVVEGKKLESSQFDVFEAAWPQDGTELSGKEVSLYFDADKRFPLPFWIQIETSHATAALRAIDSGSNLPSQHPKMPRRIPEFVGPAQKTETGLRLSLKSPKYYRDFQLFAVDITNREKQIYPITHSLVAGEEEFLSLEIDQEQLKQVLEQDHRYTWLLIPNGHTESYTESVKPFIWSGKN